MDRIAESAGAYRVAKRAIDLVGAAGGLLVASPFLVAAAIAIKLEDRGPVLYRRRVLGKGGVEFDAFKLRTMRVDADAWLATNPDLVLEFRRNMKLPQDPRLTRVGRLLRRFSVDEIPQLANVLRGQMSLVGPRMIHPDEVDRFGDLASDRMRVKPGLTGLWQVSGRQSLSYEQRIEMDRRYLRERSLWMDLGILARTVPEVLRGRGAF